MEMAISCDYGLGINRSVLVEAKMINGVIYVKEIFMTEDQLQASQVKWFDEAYPQHRQMLFAVPNGGTRDKRTAALMQATGVKKGVSDLILVVHHAVIFIENKIPGGKQSDEQEAFERRVSARGHLYFLLWSLQEFKDLMKKILGEPLV